MSKRGRMGDVLTGGTKDVNPQYLTVAVTESAANTFTQTELQLPVLRGGNMRGNKYQVIELLKLMIDITAGDGATASERTLALTTSTQTAMQIITNPDVIAFFGDNIIITTSGLYSPERIKIIDLTDQAGHGIIIATQSVFLGLQGVSQTSALTARCRLYYRFKNISIDEFVGLAIQNS